jgi:hypothetical protein
MRAILPIFLALSPLASVMLIGCGGDTLQSQPIVAGDDAGSTTELDATVVPYQGPTNGGPIPNSTNPLTGNPTGDAGPFMVDTTCCTYTFSIPDNQPSGTTGYIIGTYGPVAEDGGLSLTLADGTWTASACIPINSALNYWYEFTPPLVDAGLADASDADAASADAADADAGDAGESDGGDEDGGTGSVVAPTTIREYNPNAPHQDDGDGHIDNTYGPFASCSGIDGG